MKPVYWENLIKLENSQFTIFIFFLNVTCPRRSDTGRRTIDGPRRENIRAADEWEYRRERVSRFPRSFARRFLAAVP